MCSECQHMGDQATIGEHLDRLAMGIDEGLVQSVLHDHTADLFEEIHRPCRARIDMVASLKSMPFPVSSFDAVVNIESSHCYESMDAFLAEVCRVLRPGGRFFFADLRTMDGVNTLREQFNACDLKSRRRPTSQPTF